MNNLILTQNPEIFNGQIIAVIKEGEMWFMVKAIAKILETENPRQMLINADVPKNWIWKAKKSEILNAIDPEKNNPDVRSAYSWNNNGATFVNTKGLFMIINNSKSKIAKPFKIWCAELAEKYIKGELIENDKIKQYAETRKKGILKRNLLTEEIKNRIPEPKPYDYANCTNKGYMGLYGKDSKQLKKELQIHEKQNLKDKASLIDLALIDIADTSARLIMNLNNANNRNQVYNACEKGGEYAKNIYINETGQQREIQAENPKIIKKAKKLIQNDI